jgi:hypothetical protein
LEFLYGSENGRYTQIFCHETWGKSRFLGTLFSDKTMNSAEEFFRHERFDVAAEQFQMAQLVVMGGYTIPIIGHDHRPSSIDGQGSPI